VEFHEGVEVQNGKIVRGSIRYDAQALLHQMGLA
jgi:hypothetical protein